MKIIHLLFLFSLIGNSSSSFFTPFEEERNELTRTLRNLNKLDDLREKLEPQIKKILNNLEQISENINWFTGNIRKGFTTESSESCDKKNEREETFEEIFAIIPTGEKSLLIGGSGGNHKDDFEKFANTVGKSSEIILQTNFIKDFQVRQIIVRRGMGLIHSLQFHYQITTVDGKIDWMWGNEHGSKKGQEQVVNLRTNEYLLKISGKSCKTTRRNADICQLSFFTYSPCNINEINVYGPYGYDNGNNFELHTPTFIFGKSGVDLDSIGTYKGQVNYYRCDVESKNLKEENKLLKERIKFLENQFFNQIKDYKKDEL